MWTVLIFRLNLYIKLASITYNTETLLAEVSSNCHIARGMACFVLHLPGIPDTVCSFVLPESFFYPAVCETHHTGSYFSVFLSLFLSFSYMYGSSYLDKPYTDNFYKFTLGPVFHTLLWETLPTYISSGATELIEVSIMEKNFCLGKYNWYSLGIKDKCLI